MNWIDERYAAERMNNLLREVQQDQMARQVARDRTPRSFGARTPGRFGAIFAALRRTRPTCPVPQSHERAR